jgi:hypothetical protein
VIYTLLPTLTSELFFSLIMMLSGMLDVRRPWHVKRELFKVNIGEHESNPQIAGNNNKVLTAADLEKGEPSTLLRKAGDQVGKILEGGTSIVVAPAKWLAHMQENW